VSDMDEGDRAGEDLPPPLTEHESWLAGVREWARTRAEPEPSPPVRVAFGWLGADGAYEVAGTFPAAGGQLLYDPIAGASALSRLGWGFAVSPSRPAFVVDVVT